MSRWSAGHFWRCSGKGVETKRVCGSASGAWPCANAGAAAAARPVTAALGGTSYYGASLELQFPIFGMPREVGLRGAVFADAGTLFGYKGRTDFSGIVGYDECPGYTGPNYRQSSCITVKDENKIRSSVGASLLWASPLGPIRFDYAFALSKVEGDLVGGIRRGGDVTQAFRFSGGTSF